MPSDFEILNLWTKGEGQLNHGIQKLDVPGSNIFWGGGGGGGPPALARLLYSIL
jgi:hypothetical protein